MKLSQMVEKAKYDSDDNTNIDETNKEEERVEEERIEKEINDEIANLKSLAGI